MDRWQCSLIQELNSKLQVNDRSQAIVKARQAGMGEKNKKVRCIEHAPSYFLTKENKKTRPHSKDHGLVNFIMGKKYLG